MQQLSDTDLAKVLHDFCRLLPVLRHSRGSLNTPRWTRHFRSHDVSCRNKAYSEQRMSDVNADTWGWPLLVALLMPTAM